MNIFWLDNDPFKCAEYHVDKHVVKMILELAQIMSTTHRIHESKVSRDWDKDLLRATHTKHPVTKWASQNDAHYRKTFLLWRALLDEYTHRYGKFHKLECLIPILIEKPDIFLSEETEAPQCMPDEYKAKNLIQAYRNYYIGAKSHLAKWKNRPTPDWYLTGS